MHVCERFFVAAVAIFYFYPESNYSHNFCVSYHEKIDHICALSDDGIRKNQLCVNDLCELLKDMLKCVSVQRNAINNSEARRKAG